MSGGYSDNSSIQIYMKRAYSITVTDDGNGTGSASPNPAAPGEMVALTATPGSGYRFKEWQNVSGGASLSGTAANPATFEMPGNDVTVKAVFEQIPSQAYTITVTDDGNGTSSASPNPAAQDETVTLTATPNSGYRFREWQVVSGGASLSGTAANPTTFEMPGNDVTVKAVFEQIPSQVYNITVTDDGNGMGSASPNPAAQGETVTLTATPNSGYRFKEWLNVSGGASLSGMAANPATFEMPGNDVAVKAVFEQIPSTSQNGGNSSNGSDPALSYMIRYYRNVEDGEDPCYRQGVHHGETPVVTDRVPWRDGHRFLHWTTDPEGDGPAYSAGDSLRANANIDLYAQWEKLPHSTAGERDSSANVNDNPGTGR